MTRILGIVTGSALAVALIIGTLGVPSFTAGPIPKSDVAPLAATPEHVALSETPTEEFPAVADVVEAVPLEPAVQTAAHVEATLPVDDTLPVEDALPAEDALPIEVASQADDSGDIAAAHSEPAAALTRPTVVDEHWFAFWSPFRSELAANGFVEHLQRTTGLDYRVIKLKPGVYEVAFAYDDSTDIENKLAAISAATGLEMPDG